MKVECAKETVDVTKTTTDYVNQQIKNLSRYITINAKKYVLVIL